MLVARRRGVVLLREIWRIRNSSQSHLLLAAASARRSEGESCHPADVMGALLNASVPVVERIYGAPLRK